ncbi:MAG: hypothetical protein IJJ99_03955 [Oscillospiraceae bacterium]|nr:hypothetical protein [Oscillospiraceae bacterium]
MLVQAYTPEGLDRLIAQYCEAYHGIYGTISESMSADEQRDVFMKYVEEICADAYAGIRRGGINTVKAEQVMAAFRSDRTDSGRQTAAATDRTNGPGEQRYSLSPDTDIEEENIKNGTDALNWLIEQAKESDDPESLIRRNAMYRSDIGQIDFVWGKPGKGEKLRSGYGISHIIARHGETTAQKAVEVLAKGVEYDKQRNDNTNPSDYRLRLYYDGYTAVLVKDENSHWLLTAWENDVKTAVSAAGEVYGSSGATAVTPTHTRRNGVNTAVSDNSISDERGKSIPSDKKSTDAAYLSLAEKYRDGTASEEETAELQRMVDQAAKAAGYSIPAWHGTSGDEFTVFEYGHNRKHYSTGKNLGEGFYFATSKEYAENYADTSNGNARTIQSALKMDHPYVQYGTEFDYADLAKLSKEAGYEVTKKNVSEYLQSKEYDGVINKGYDGKDRTYVVYDSEQVKSADPVTYDDDGNIIPLSERFRTDRTGEEAWKNSDIRYSVEDDAAEYDEDYLRAVWKDAAEDEPTEKGRSFLPQRDAALGTDYAAIATEEIERRAKEASLKELRQMLKTSEAELNKYRWAKRKGILPDELAERMKTVEETVKIQSEELKHKNAEERKQRQKRQDEEAKQQQPRIAKKELKAKLAESFHVAPGQRAITNDLIEQAANKILQRGYLDAEDKRSLFNALLKSGVVNIAPEGYYGEIRSYVQQGRIYVPESVREEFVQII